MHSLFITINTTQMILCLMACSLLVKCSWNNVSSGGKITPDNIDSCNHSNLADTNSSRAHRRSISLITTPPLSPPIKPIKSCIYTKPCTLTFMLSFSCIPPPPHFSSLCLKLTSFSYACSLHRSPRGVSGRSAGRSTTGSQAKVLRAHAPIGPAPRPLLSILPSYIPSSLLPLLPTTTRGSSIPPLIPLHSVRQRQTTPSIQSHPTPTNLNQTNSNNPIRPRPITTLPPIRPRPLIPLPSPRPRPPIHPSIRPAKHPP